MKKDSDGFKGGDPPTGGENNAKAKKLQSVSRLQWKPPVLTDLSVLNTMGGGDRLNDESQTVLGNRGYF